jgi:SAM-dependent methyltransferase
MFEGIDPLDAVQVGLIILLTVLVAHYVYIRWMTRYARSTELEGVEGFANPDGPDGDMVVLGNEHLFDDFYSRIYDKIVDGAVRQKAEVVMTLNYAKSVRPEEKSISVLDIGCGTGGDVAMFKAEGVGKVVGLDASDAMIAAVAHAQYTEQPVANLLAPLKFGGVFIDIKSTYLPEAIIATGACLWRL